MTMSEHGSDGTDFLEATMDIEAEKQIADFMNDIHNETAAQLLNAVLHEVSPFGTSGIRALDEQLVLGSAGHSSLASPLNRGDVIEVQGPPASGKTQLSYQLVMNCILPRELLLKVDDGSYMAMDQRLEIGGWERGAIILDTDGRWNVVRLRCMLSARFLAIRQKYGSSQLSPSVEQWVDDCMKRVHMFKPKSTVSMAYSILQLPKYHSQRMSNLEIALLVIDTVSAFYWQDRLDVEQQRNTEKKEIAYPMDHFLIALQNFRLTYGTVILMTNWGLSPNSNQTAMLATQQLPRPTATSATQPDPPLPFYRQHLYPFPSPFEFPSRVLLNAHLYPPITHHMTLSASPIPIISPETRNLAEVEEALRRRSSAMAVLAIIRFVSSGMSGNFTMKVGPDGITS